MVSKCHSIWGDRRKNLYIPISKEDVLSLQEFYNDIYDFLSCIINEESNIYCNPRLDNGIIFGDADLIINNEIMDFKTSYHEDINIEYTLQLLIYTALARNKGIQINKVSIYNPLCGIYYYADVSDWDKDEDLLEYLISKVKLKI